MNSETIMKRKELTHIDDVKPINEKDQQCMAEIRDVLKKHNKLKRFGLFLLHDHFPMEEDEVLLETHDIKNRSLKLTPVKKKDLDRYDLIETSWNLDTGKAVGSYKIINGHHNLVH